MLNRIGCIILAFILVVGLLFKPILGLLFITTLILLFVSLIYTCERIIVGEVNIKLFVDAVLKTLYFFATAILFSVEFGSPAFISTIIGFICCLFIDIFFIHIKYSFMQKTKTAELDSTIKQINLRHLIFKFGDHDSLFGANDKATQIRALAWVAPSYGLTVITIAVGVYLGILYREDFFRNITIPLCIIILVSATDGFFFHNAFALLQIKSAYKLIMILLPFLSSGIIFISAAFKSLSQIFLFTSAFGLVIGCCAFYALSVSARCYMNLINKTED